MERQHMGILAWMVGAPSTAVILCILMAALWEYRVALGLCLLILVCLIVGVYLRGLITEQNLRIYRFDHQHETPLDQYGEPRLWRHDMQENPHRYSAEMHQQHTY